MTKKQPKDRAAMAEIAGGRARVYDLLVGIFNRIPDDQFIEGINSDNLQHFLSSCCDLDSSRFQLGVDRIRAYQSDMEGRPREEVLEELAVDRTRILRGTGHSELKPPYEGVYSGKKNFGDSLLEIKRFYRKAGIMPDASVSESPDYICVEMDFMKQLCIREQKQWAEDGDGPETLKTEEGFLKAHLARWAGDFCDQVEKYALTDFYRGFSMITGAFIQMDLGYLQDLNV
jgi:TorA maturation chaperone TorD